MLTFSFFPDPGIFHQNFVLGSKMFYLILIEIVYLKRGVRFLWCLGPRMSEFECMSFLSSQYR
jgi:hypothetical protein